MGNCAQQQLGAGWSVWHAACGRPKALSGAGARMRRAVRRECLWSWDLAWSGHRHGALVDGVAPISFRPGLSYNAEITQHHTATKRRPTQKSKRPPSAEPDPAQTLCRLHPRSDGIPKKTPGGRGAGTHRYPAHTAARGAAEIRSLLTISRKVLYSSPFAFRSALTHKNTSISPSSQKRTEEPHCRSPQSGL